MKTNEKWVKKSEKRKEDDIGERKVSVSFTSGTIHVRLSMHLSIPDFGTPPGTRSEKWSRATCPDSRLW